MKRNGNHSTRPLMIFATAVALVSLSGSGTIAADVQQVFKTPEAAAAALAEAAKNDDAKAATQILGPGSLKLITSGDTVADKNAAQRFAKDYAQMHRLAYGEKSDVILYIGAENWPFPIPIVEQDGRWVFDTAKGEKELLYRRIGTNELFTIATLRELAAAEEEYKSSNSDHQFARKLTSDTGTRDGLYWPVSAGETQSPIGPLVARAASEGYPSGTQLPTPFHGYYYKILTSQGANAPGGQKDYMVDSKLTGGFAILAFPASYRSSGVMTFIVNQDGFILQKDLGPDTEKLAQALGEYNPDNTWTEVKEYSNE
jgi:hypothetical protein